MSSLMQESSCNKENQVPEIRQSCVTHNSQIHHDLEQKISQLERATACARGEDVVQVWCDYVNWAAKMCDHVDEKTILSRACLALCSVQRYHDDPRHLRLWVMHAKNLPRPQDVFKYLHDQRVGVGQALLYEAWATSLEQQHEFSQAESIFRAGITCGAHPTQRLQSRFQDFQKRMKKRSARSVKSVSKLPGSVAHDQTTPLAEVGGSRMLAPVKGACSCEWNPKEDAEPQQVVNHEMHGQSHSFKNQCPAIGENLCRKSGKPMPGLFTTSAPTQPMAHPQASTLTHSRAPTTQELRARGERALFTTSAPTQPQAHPQASTFTHSRASTTQELTTSGVRALLRCSRSSQASVSSSIFEEPTYTMEVAKCEVLNLLAHDTSPRGHRHQDFSARSRTSSIEPPAHQSGSTDNSSLHQPMLVENVASAEGRVTCFFDEFAELQAMQSDASPKPKPACCFDVYEETDFHSMDV